MYQPARDAQEDSQGAARKVSERRHKSKDEWGEKGPQAQELRGVPEESPRNPQAERGGPSRLEGRRGRLLRTACVGTSRTGDAKPVRELRNNRSQAVRVGEQERRVQARSDGLDSTLYALPSQNGSRKSASQTDGCRGTRARRSRPTPGGRISKKECGPIGGTSSRKDSCRTTSILSQGNALPVERPSSQERTVGSTASGHATESLFGIVNPDKET